ncbi:hypothetical protein NDU88_006135 [Pleurodeles waltl]|uniref:Uncharacterized protein n=1 Tax=Pleurodeles waltl TaxID=8319 RepID=A0AAV7NSK4_PLEWA|nr:hypothetical protein NDU88_006135 [Pleurodeles waltl]
MVALLGYVKDVPPGVCNLRAMLLLLAKRGRRLVPHRAGWIRHVAYCQEQFTGSWELMPVRSHPSAMWAPLEHYLVAQAAGGQGDVAQIQQLPFSQKLPHPCYWLTDIPAGTELPVPTDGCPGSLCGKPNFG